MQRKPTKNTRGPSAAEKAHLRWVKERSICSGCGASSPVIGHHCEGATFRHNKTLIGHWFILGLCQCCDDLVTHGSRRALREMYGPQSEMWLAQYAVYQRETGRAASSEIVNAITNWGR